MAFVSSKRLGKVRDTRLHCTESHAIHSDSDAYPIRVYVGRHPNIPVCVYCGRRWYK